MSSVYFIYRVVSKALLRNCQDIYTLYSLLPTKVCTVKGSELSVTSHLKCRGRWFDSILACPYRPVAHWLEHVIKHSAVYS